MSARPLFLPSFARRANAQTRSALEATAQRLHQAEELLQRIQHILSVRQDDQPARSVEWGWLQHDIAAFLTE